MMHSLPRQKSLVIVVIGILITALVMMTHISSSYAATVDRTSSTVSFRVYIDQAKPGNSGDNSVEQPDIPENGQKIHYIASKQHSESKFLPQTGIVGNLILIFIGSLLILIVVKYQSRYYSVKEDAYED